MDALTIFDYIIISILVYSTFIAFFKGFIKTSTSFLAWIISFAGTYSIYPYLFPFIKKYVPTNEILNKILTGFASYFIVLIIVSFISNKIINSTSNVRGGIIDRSLGLSFGLLRGMLISCAIFYLITLVSSLFTLSFDKDERAAPGWLKKAESYYLLNKGTDIIVAILPDKIQKDMKFYREKAIKLKDSSDLLEISKDKIEFDRHKEMLPSIESDNERKEMIEVLSEYGKEMKKEDVDQSMNMLKNLLKGFLKQ